MKVQIIKGQHQGKIGEIIKKVDGVERRLAGGSTTTNSVTVVVKGMLYPVELSPSEYQANHN